MRTPGTAFAFASSQDFGFPPTTGHRTTLAIFMPGRCTSEAKSDSPATMRGASMRRRSFPITRHCAFGFRAGEAGTGRRLAAVASSP